MRLWALSDPHLTLSTPSKAMHVFGEHWRDHERRIAGNWAACVATDDVVLLPGDISWASGIEDALTDLHFLARLPGIKVLGKGNHERWWQSVHEVRRNLPPGMLAVDGDHVAVGPWLIFGTRLWDHPEVEVRDLVRWNTARGGRPADPSAEELAALEKIWAREIGRLERCVENLPRNPARRVAMVHHPPVGQDLSSTRASRLIEASGAKICVFGHLHNIRPERFESGAGLLGTERGVSWVLASCDVRAFRPVLLDDTP